MSDVPDQKPVAERNEHGCPGCRQTAEYRIAADVAVTDEYADGRRLHHVPIMLEDIKSGAAMERTIPVLHATGYRVDMLWWETGESCCPPNPPVPCTNDAP